MVRSLARYTFSKWKQIAKYTLIGSVAIILIGGLTYSHLFGPVDTNALSQQQFIVEPNTSVETVVETLHSEGLIKNTWAFRLAFLEEAKGRHVKAGGYTLSQNMDAWSVAGVLARPPALAFITFPQNLRKEQMGDILADALNWSDAELKDWNTTATDPDPSFVEGVYYADTYLIPSDQTPEQVAARMRGRFMDEFAPYMKEAQAKGMKWTDVLTLASIVDRESALNDRGLVAGILLNRLDNGMKLQADATLQYVKGTEGNWWPAPTSDDKYLNSPFNTYQHTGLPPHPIDNPSLGSIDAVLNPVDTDCLFYLHDESHQIHCSLTYAGQVKNVNTYLR